MLPSFRGTNNGDGEMAKAFAGIVFSEGIALQIGTGTNAVSCDLQHSIRNSFACKGSDVLLGGQYQIS